ncbi:MAG: hypothetical protein ACRDP8_23605 [Actinopolymorphaceae bacterium]
MTGKFLSLTFKAGTVIGGRMMSLVRDLTPLVLGILLTWTGATTLLDRSTGQQTAAHALLHQLLGDGPSATALRIVGWAELLVGLGLLGIPSHRLPGVGAVVLGLAYVGILTYARTRPPAALEVAGPPRTVGAPTPVGTTDPVPAGTTDPSAAGPADAVGTGAAVGKATAATSRMAGGAARVRWQSYVRAGLVIAGGLLASSGAASWWMAGGRHPVASFAIVVIVTLVLVALSAPVDQLWARCIPRLRVRLPQPRPAHPLEGVDSAVWTVPIPAGEHEDSPGHSPAP